MKTTFTLLMITAFHFLAFAQLGEFEGDVKSTSLSGVDDRNVVAAADGTLKIGTDQSIKYLSIPASAFQPTAFEGTISICNSSYAGFNSTSPAGIGFVAPVFLPHNSQIITITYHHWDISPTQDCIFNLSEYNASTNTTIGGFTPSPTSSGNGGNGVINVSPSSAFVNNHFNSYSVSMMPALGNSLGGFFRIHTVVIAYK